jgi:hypothetical protein
MADTPQRCGDLRRAYLRLLADLLNGGIVEVTRVAEEIADLEGVAQTTEDILYQAALAKLLVALLLAVSVDLLHPGVVISGGRSVRALLELDDVRVGNDAVGSSLVERSRAPRSRSGNVCQRESYDTSHRDDQVSTCGVMTKWNSGKSTSDFWSGRKQRKNRRLRR